MRVKVRSVLIKCFKRASPEGISLSGLGDFNVIIGEADCGKTSILGALEYLKDLKGLKEGIQIRGDLRLQKNFYCSENNRPIEITYELLIEGLEEAEGGSGSASASGSAKSITIRLREHNHKLIWVNAEEVRNALGKELFDKLINHLSSKVALIPDARVGPNECKNALRKVPEDKVSEAVNILRQRCKSVSRYASVDSPLEGGRLMLSMERPEGRTKTTEEPSTIGSGIRSAVPLFINCELARDGGILLVDEPEIGLHPTARYNLMTYLLWLATNAQVFITTHDPAFINPLIIERYGSDNKIKVKVFLHSMVSDSFVKVNLMERDFESYAGFLPQATSTKRLHIYVEGSTDQYIMGELIRRHLIELSRRGMLKADWFRVMDQVGIFHLGGKDYLQNLIHMIPLHVPSIVILDHNEETLKNLEKIAEKAEREKIAGYLVPRIKLCKSLNNVEEALRNCKKGLCAVYFLNENDILNYFGSKDLNAVINHIVTGDYDSVVAESREIIELVNVILRVNDYLREGVPEGQVVFEDDFEERGRESEIPLGWVKLDKGLIVVDCRLAHSGSCSARKVKFGDPNGAAASLGRRVCRGEGVSIVLTGWVFSDPLRPRNVLFADRISLEDSEGNGYGFRADHSNNPLLFIERREKGRPVGLVSKPWKSIDGEWYKFELRISKEEITLSIFDKGGNRVEPTLRFKDTKVACFDRVAIRGGIKYNVDDLKVTLIKEQG